MAKAATIKMTETKLFKTREDQFFGIKRFDRIGNKRFHIHTFGNLIHANFRIPSCDYEQFFKVIKILTGNHQDV
ncbi:HipA-like protein, partial [Candidatus Magnetomorum sp. HK-1]